MAAMDDAGEWARGLDGLVERIAPRFRRVGPWRRGVAYVKGLLAPVEHKNGWQLAEAAGDAGSDGMQDFLARMRCDADQVRDDLRAYVVAHLGDTEAVLVLDETRLLKKGTKSVAVQRQYSGTAGPIENSQIGVFLGYTSRHGHALIGRALYLPESGAVDLTRRHEAGVPQDVAFATKPKLGGKILARVFSARVLCAWVTEDSVYGAHSALRRAIETSGHGYVLAVTSTQQHGCMPVADWLEDVQRWHRLSAGDGACPGGRRSLKGPRLYNWAFLPYRSDAVPGWQTGLLIRRCAQAGAPSVKISKPDKFTFYLTCAPEATTLPDLVRSAGMRWAIKACFEEAKGEVGLDHYELSLWIGWHRHITLAMFAHTYLAVVRQAVVGGRGHRRVPKGSAATHRPRGAGWALASRPGSPARSERRRPLVTLAPMPPAARQTMSLETTDQNS